jgi:membrane-associated phospholipid phosphatase
MLIEKFQQLFKWLEHQSLLVRLRKQYPGLFSFLLARLDPKHFTGLPLTVILLIFCVNALLLSRLTEAVLESERIVLFDAKFTELLYKTRTVWVSKFFFFISYFGSREAVFIVGGLITALLLVKKKYIAIIAFWVMMAGTGFSVRYGKQYISRDRPENVAYYTEKYFSFPSGHATTSMVLYGFCSYLLYRIYYSVRLRKSIFYLSGFLILSVGFSRIYLGVHYLSDVLAGYILGLLWVLLGLSILEWLQYVKRRNRMHL